MLIIDIITHKMHAHCAIWSNKRGKWVEGTNGNAGPNWKSKGFN